MDEVDNLQGIEMQVNTRHIKRRLLCCIGLQNEDLAIWALDADRTLLGSILQEGFQ